MPQSQHIEVIIVGAGPSGLSCAMLLGNAGIKTLVLEKGSPSPFYSGVLFKNTYKSIFENISIPFERNLSEYRAYYLSDDFYTSINQNEKNGQNFIVQRHEFDKWLLKEVKANGVSVASNEVVRELIIDNNKICGVKTDNDEHFANIVIIAEGLNSLLCKSSGLRTGELLPGETFIFAEENIELPCEVIEERLNLKPNQGIAAKLFLNNYFQAQSLGYFYTNRASITLGCGVLLSESILKKRNINQYLEKLKSHPIVKSILSGGKTTSYTSYILPYNISSRKNLQKLFVGGCLVIGGAALLINPLDWDISYLPVTSGKLAAQTILTAKELNDFSKKTLSKYEKLIIDLIKAETCHELSLQHKLISDNVNINDLAKLMTKEK